MLSYNRETGQFSTPTAQHMFTVWCDGFDMGLSYRTFDSGVVDHAD